MSTVKAILINNWALWSAPSEQGHIALKGEIEDTLYGSGGTVYVQTSQIVGKDIDGDVVTSGGVMTNDYITVYKLGTVNAQYDAAFPNAKERLLNQLTLVNLKGEDIIEIFDNIFVKDTKVCEMSKASFNVQHEIQRTVINAQPGKGEYNEYLALMGLGTTLMEMRTIGIRGNRQTGKTKWICERMLDVDKNSIMIVGTTNHLVPVLEKYPSLQGRVFTKHEFFQYFGENGALAVLSDTIHSADTTYVDDSCYTFSTYGTRQNFYQVLAKYVREDHLVVTMN